MQSTPTKRTRLIQLDVLRAIACGLVIISHSPSVPGNALMQALARGGWVGVDLFFVLSGFLVTSLLFNEYSENGYVRPGRFAIRRALKIYPTFYVFLLVTTLCIAVLANDLSNISMARICAEVFFVQNYFDSTWGHTWSLAVEEHFYIAVILLVWICSRFGSGNPFRHWPLLVFAVCLVTLGLRIIFAQKLTTVPQATHLRCDAMAMGILLAHFWSFRQHSFVEFSNRYRVILLCVGLLLLLPPFLLHWRDYSWIRVFGLTFNYLGSGAILLAVIPMDLSRSGWFARSLAWVGTFSYSIYVWHAVVATWINPRLQPHLAGISLHLPWIVSILLSVVLGVVVAHLVEVPMLKLRDALYPSPERTHL
jgi:peptidoglycan/LPS O-acetylase OafA/YrhL